LEKVLSRPRLALLATLALATLAWAPIGSASYLVSRNASDPALRVDSEGRAVVSYRRGVKTYRPLFWGAINARPPTSGAPQVEFGRDYSGGWGSFRKPLWKTLRDECLQYDGPPLPYLVAACKAPDGSYWALQSWRRMLPNLGFEPWKPEQSASELHLSHWSGDLPRLEVYTDWVYSNRFHHIFGRLTYLGQPVYGFAATNRGSPTDSYGRNIYLDTLDSAYGVGWLRENSFLTHKPNGNFCYGFYPHNPYPGYPAAGRRPPGNGARYRLTAIGPGVTPIIAVEIPGLHTYVPTSPADRGYEQQMNAAEDQLAAGDQSRTPCRRR
jgi:hypothetical protein